MATPTPKTSTGNCEACWHLWSVHGPDGCTGKVFPAHSLTGEPCPCEATAATPALQDDGPNPLDDRLLAMARILRETGNEDAADEIEMNAAFVREAWRGSDDRCITSALDTIAAYVAELARIVRDWPAEADEADRLPAAEDGD